MKKICIFVPEGQADEVKSAMFQAGAGKIGHYDCCSWECRGTGQFRPLGGSHPALGRQGEIETVRELKVEMVCEDALLPQALAAMKKAHPYETPAYEVMAMVDL